MAAPPGSPVELEIRWEAPEPLLPEESDLGIPVERAAAAGGALPKHRLVTLGDSLTMGVKSLAIVDTGLSWPAILAHTLGLGGNDFTYPRFAGPVDCPGLPLNLEAIVRGIDTAGAGRPFFVRQAREALAARLPFPTSRAIGNMGREVSYRARASLIITTLPFTAGTCGMPTRARSVRRWRR